MLEVVMLVFLSAGTSVPADLDLEKYNRQFSDRMNARIEYHSRARENLEPYVMDAKVKEFCNKYLRKTRLAYDKANNSIRKDSMCLIEDSSKN